MKMMLTMTILILLLIATGPAYGQAHHPTADSHHAAIQPATSNAAADQMMDHCHMMMNAQLASRDPAVLLGKKDQLKLTDQQIKQLQTLAQKTRKAAMAILTDAQRQQVNKLPQQPQSMMQMCRSMTGHMKGMQGMSRMQGMRHMDMCSMMMRGMMDDTSTRHGQSGSATQGNAATPQSAGQAAVDEIITAYLTVRQQLASDAMQGVGDQFAKLHHAAQTLARKGPLEVRQKAKAVADAVRVEPKNLDGARKAFKSLSAAMVALVKVIPPSTTAAPSLYEVYCPMEQASWLQVDRKIDNPYLGKAMPSCGMIKETLRSSPQG